MQNLEFPIVGTKVPGLIKKFDLNSPEGRKKYFEAKVGDEIRHLQNYFNEGNTFIAYLLGKKNSGKGTYSKLFTEIFGEENIATVSVGDLVREMDDWESFKKTKKYEKMKGYYRGYVSFDEAVKAHLGRSTSKLLPTEFILALLKAHIDDLQRKSIFIDGLPREMDQVSYSLYFRDLINYRNDPDLFVLIDIPEAVIDERIKYRVICPKCNTSRNLKLLITSKIEYDQKEGKFYLLCDNPSCGGNGKLRMLRKEGDDLGISPIRGRLDKDEEILKKALNLYGVPKILLRNHVPVNEEKKYYDDYEITPEYVLFWDNKNKKVKVQEKSWSVKDDNGEECFSLLAPPVLVSMIKQMVDILSL
jgi:adenylate kinase family enzyme